VKIPHSPATVSSDEIPTVPLSLSKLGKARESRQRPVNADAKTAKSGDLPKAINVHLFRRGFGRVTDLANFAISCFPTKAGIQDYSAKEARSNKSESGSR
jgi:hypothetical protein